MKNYFWLCLICSVVISCPARGQGTFVFDQQSATVETAPVGTFINFQPVQPFGQSFVPTLSSIEFVRIFVYDNTLFPPSSIYVNLLSDSITGAVMATTATISLHAGAFGYTNFYFPNAVPLMPGTTYYLQPVASVGDPATQSGVFYANGSLFENGNAINDDLWFREGIVVPEPAVTAIAIMGLVTLAVCRRRRCCRLSGRSVGP